MGVGGSTSSRPGSATILVKSRTPSELTSRAGSAHAGCSQRNDSIRPTGSCCSHYRKNHSSIERTGTPPSDTAPPPNDSIDDEIEEIVANTLDLVSNPKPGRTNSHYGGTDPSDQIVDFSAYRDSEARGSAAGSGMELRRTLTRTNTRTLHKRPSDEISEDKGELHSDAKVSSLKV